MKEDSFKKPSILEVENLNLAYGEYQVLEKVSFSAKRGKCTVLMGGSGCGKSTFADLILGLLNPTKGNIYVDGKQINDQKQNWFANVASVPQNILP